GGGRATCYAESATNLHADRRKPLQRRHHPVRGPQVPDQHRLAPRASEIGVMMNWPYLHITINHFPIILTVVGSAVLVLALVVRRRGVWLYALATLTLAGASIYPAFFTGDRAAHAVRDTWYILRAAVEEHDA